MLGRHPFRYAFVLLLAASSTGLTSRFRFRTGLGERVAGKQH